jgi:hypothetical protein
LFDLARYLIEALRRCVRFAILRLTGTRGQKSLAARSQWGFRHSVKKSTGYKNIFA